MASCRVMARRSWWQSPGRGWRGRKWPVGTARQPLLPNRDRCEQGGGASWAVGQTPIKASTRIAARATQRSEGPAAGSPSRTGHLQGLLMADGVES